MIPVGLYKKDAVVWELKSKRSAKSSSESRQKATPLPKKCQHTSNVESYEQHLLYQAV